MTQPREEMTEPRAAATESQPLIFERLAERQDAPAEMLDSMIDHFRRLRRPAELFEALKMRVRQQAGLLLIPGEDDVTRPDEIERQLELGLLDACREAGTMLIEDGKVREGWMYLRPTGDLDLARRLLQDVAIDEENYDSMVQVLLHEGVDVGRGYQAVLEHQGTCNSITLYDQTVASQSKASRRAAAARLVDHLYQELTESVRGDIARREAPAGDQETLIEMLESRRWLLEGGGYHTDTTHIASTVRIASVLDDPASLRKAWELTQYGRRLDSQYQYAGDEPFVDFYPAYATFYSTLLGEEIDAGLKWFERKARTVEAAQHGTGAIETYLDLLDRVGRSGQAVEAAIELVPEDLPPQRIVPLLLEMARRAGERRVYEKIADYCQRHDDVLGFAAVIEASRGAD